MATINKKKVKAGWMPQTPEHNNRIWGKMQTADVKYLQSPYWRGVRNAVITRDNGLCQECLKYGITTPGNQVDHIIARHDSEIDYRYNEDMDNLQTLCLSCHSRKTAKERHARK